MIERRDEHGFTLLELMIALFVLSVAIAGLVGVLDTAFGTTAVDVHRIDATGLATQELASLRARPYAEIVAPYTPAAPVLTTINNQQFATSYTASWVSSSDNDADAYKQVSVTVTWRDQVGAHTIEQDSDVYPGGLGPYNTVTSQGPSPSTSTTMAGCPAPIVSATPLVTAQPSGDPSLDVSWPEPDPASSVVPIVSWAVQVSPDGSTWTTALNDEPPLVVGQTHQIEIGGLTPGISYQVQLLAFGACGPPGVSPTGTATGPITATLMAPDCTVGAVSLSSPVAPRLTDGSLAVDVTVVASTATGCSAGLWAGVVTSGAAVIAVPLEAEPGGWFTASLDATGPWDLGPHTIEVFSGVLIAGPLPTSPPPLGAAELCVIEPGGSSC